MKKSRRKQKITLAPDWRPGSAAALRSIGEGVAVSEHFGRVRAAAFQRAEACVAGRVAGYSPLSLDPSGPLPFGPARGMPGLGAISEFIPASSGVGFTLIKRKVRRRRGSRVLEFMPERLRLVADRYADVVERVEGADARDMDALRGGGVSDGGAVARTGLAQVHRAACGAIGRAVVLLPDGRTSRARPVTVDVVVDRICVRGWTVSELLVVNGWCVTGKRAHTKAVAAALAGALNRLCDVL